MWCLIASFHTAFCASTWVRTIMPVPVLPDPKDMNDTPPDHPARHEAWHSQWKCPNRVPLINGQLPYPTGAFRAPSSPACVLRVANQRAGSITNSLLRKGEWRSYCRCIDTPCFSHMTWNYIFFKLSRKNKIHINTAKQRDSHCHLQAAWPFSAPLEFGCHSGRRLR